VSAPREIAGYRLEAKIGEGGMGAVFKATHPRFPGQTFALKLLLGEGDVDAEAHARFQRETQALRVASGHPNIVRVFGGAIEGNRPYILMELVPGESLAKLARGRGLEARRSLEIVRDVCDAIAYVHKEGIIHRDLKPENILVEASGRPRVCDFGLARLVDAERLTKSGMVFGTPTFSAPEQIDGRAKEADGRADVYALGAVLWFTLVGRPPFEAATQGHLLKRVLLERPERPSRHMVAGGSEDLDAICFKALEKEPEDRYESASAMRADLDLLLQGEPVSAKVPGLGRRVRQRVRRQWREGSLVIVGLIGLLAVSAATIAIRSVQKARAIERAYAEALDPGRSAVEVGLRLAILKREGVAASLIDAVEKRRKERDLEESVPLFAKMSAETPRKDEEAFLDKATAAIESACLVGEGGGFALGGALLDRREAALDAAAPEVVLGKAPPAQVETLLDDAARLAAARLKALPGDPAGSALRARVSLARIGAPREALGRGRLGLEGATSAEVLADLWAASRLPGPPGDRAAWLLVDLLVSAGSAKQPLARDALEAALKRAPDAPERTVLEPVVRAAEEPEAAWARLAPLLADPARAGAAAIELSRVLARVDLPLALEHPELAVESSAAVLARAVLDDAASFAFVADGKSKLSPGDRATRDAVVDRLEGFVRAIHRPWRQGGGEDIFKSTVTDEMKSGLALARRQLGRGAAELAARGLALSPHDSGLLDWASQEIRGGLGTVVYQILWSRLKGSATLELRWAFSKGLRDRSRLAANWHEFAVEDWDEAPELSPLRACEAFDRRLDAHVAAERIVEAGQAGGIEREVELAVRAAKGLRRLEALDEAGAALTRSEESSLVLGALAGLEAFRALGGPGALPFRSRLRRYAFPGRLGETLAHLDLERLQRLPGPGDAEHDPSRLLLASAVLAISLRGTPGPPSPEALTDVLHLYTLGIAWAHECAIRYAFPDPGDKNQDKQNRYEENLSDRHGEFDGINVLGILMTDMPQPIDVDGDLAPSHKDEVRFREKAYTFQDPRERDPRNRLHGAGR
jgi:hypothetical protein